MSEWRECKLVDIAEKIAMGPFGSNIKVSTFTSEGIPIISGNHLHNVRMEDKEFNFISFEHADRLNNCNVYHGDVIFTHAGNIGQVSFIPNNSKYNRYIISQRQFYLRCNKSFLDFEYIAYYFKSSYGQFQLLSNSNQTGVPSLAQPVSFLKEIKILLPSLPEQKAIAGVLSSLDDKIDLLHRQNKTLEQMAEALFRQWFVEEAVEDWEEGTLNDLVEFNYGRTLRDQDRSGYGFPVYGSSGIVGYHNEYLINAPGIITGRKGTLGVINYSFQNFFPIDTTFYITSKNKSDDLFFEYFLLKNLKLGEMNSDSAVPGLNRNLAHGIQLLIPPAQLIEKFNQQIKPLFKKLNVNQKQIQTLEKLRDNLLPKLMSGELRVKYTSKHTCD